MNNQCRTVTGRSKLSDRDMLFDLFASGKYMSSLYDQAFMESTNSRVKDTLEVLQQSEHQLAETLSATLQKYGWHPNHEFRQRFEQPAEHSRSLSTNSEDGGNRRQATSRTNRISSNTSTRRFSSQVRRPKRAELSNLLID